MTLRLDHLVILVGDLEAAVRDYQALGFTVQRGGTHVDGVTHNALIGFADGSYLELIAFLQPPGSHRWAAAARRGQQGFVDFALLPEHVGEVVARAQRHGLAYQGPLPGGRLRPDGVALRWEIGVPPSADLPFLCGDLTARALRVPEGEVRQHANGASGVANVTIAVSDLDASLARYQNLLGPASALGPGGLSLTGLGLRQASLPLGSTQLVLVSPGTDTQRPAAAALRQWLAAQGDGVLGLALRTQGAAASLPLDLTHGAAVDFVPERA